MVKYLIGIALLIGICLYFFSPKTDQSLDDQSINLLEINVPAITQIELKLPNEEVLSLMRRSDGWRLSNGVMTADARPEKIESLLAFLSSIKIDSLLGNQNLNLERLGLSHDRAIQWQLYEDGIAKEAFSMGLGHWDRDSARNILFVQLPVSGEAFSLQGYNSWPTELDFQSLRSKFFSQFDTSTISKINWIHKGDTLLQIGSRQDSLLKALLLTWSDLKGNTFNDQFNPVVSSESLNDQLELFNPKEEVILKIDCYWDSARAIPFTLHSNIQPDIFFTSDSTGLYEQFFVPLWEKVLSDQSPAQE